MAELSVPNLNTLIAHLEAQPASAINMGWVAVQYYEDCGTCGCIKGHAALAGWDRRETFGRWLGLSRIDDLTMPEGWRNEQDGVRRYPAHRVIATLKRLRDHYLATGEVKVDWGPEPGAEPAQSWTAPQAVETTSAVAFAPCGDCASPGACVRTETCYRRLPNGVALAPLTAPELPAEITALLRGGKVEA